MALIQPSFSYVITPIWLCCRDCLIPSRKGRYFILPLSCWFVTKPFIFIGTTFFQNWVFESAVSICPKICITFLQVRLSSGNQTYPSLSKYILKGVVLELLAPFWKREKSGIHNCGFFLPEAILSSLDEGGNRLSIEVFLPWSDLACPLLTQVPSLFLSALLVPLRWNRDAPGVYLMASQTDFQFLTIKNLAWFPLFL